jgi:hypothetical protein
VQFDEYPFDLEEMVAFVLLGALCGLLAAFFVYFHRSLIEWERNLAQREWLVPLLFRGHCRRLPTAAAGAPVVQRDACWRFSNAAAISTPSL